MGSRNEERASGAGEAETKQGKYALMAFMISQSALVLPLSVGRIKCKLAEIKANQNTFLKNKETLPNQILTQKTTWITFFSELTWGTSQY